MEIYTKINAVTDIVEPYYVMRPRQIADMTSSSSSCSRARPVASSEHYNIHTVQQLLLDVMSIIYIMFYNYYFDYI